MAIRRRGMRRPRRHRPTIGRRRHHRGSKLTMVTRQPTLIAPRFITKLKYSDEWVGPSSLGAPLLKTWRINSLFDPDRSVGGHQPYGFDQIAALYHKYRVFAVSWMVDVTPDTGLQSRCIIIPHDGVITSTNRTLLMELPRAVTKESSLGGPHIHMRGRIGLPRLRGQTSVEYKGDDENSALITADPVNELTLCVAVCHADASTTLNFQARITIIYHCEFFDPELPGQS